ncbi:DUF4219 domain-containing protein, partial [Mycobacterium kansasii]
MILTEVRNMAKGEGSLVTRPPVFNGSNYAYWKARMHYFLRSLDHDVWDIVESGYVPPSEQIVLDSGTTIKKPKSKEMWTTFNKERQISEAKAMIAIYCVVSQDIFNQI